MTRRTDCACCGRARPIKARGLCPACVFKTRADGTYIDYPRITRSTEDTMADYHLLRSEGHSDQQIAERLGMKLATLRRAVLRARARERELGGVLAR